MSRLDILNSDSEGCSGSYGDSLGSTPSKIASVIPESVSELVGGLPSEVYTSPQFLELERQTIFTENWICVGLASDVAQPGDMIPVDLAGIPIVLVRDRQGTLRAFHNICSHRGIQLVTQPCQKQGIIRCPYHSWSYGLDGALKSTPHFGGYYQDSYDGFDRSSKGLQPVRCDQWLDMVFVNVSGTAPPLMEYLGPIVERWSTYDLSLLRKGKEVSFECQANWKLAIENFSESYHLAWVHPSLNSYSRMEDHFSFDVGANHIGQGSLRYISGQINGRSLPAFPNLDVNDPALDVPDRTMVAEYVSIFPNLMVGVHPDYFLVFMASPLSPERTYERMAFYFVGDEAMKPEYDELRDFPVDLWTETNHEDIDVIQRMQIGRRSPAFTGGCLSPALEETVHQFQRLVYQATRYLPNPAIAQAFPPSAPMSA
jgi:choline monooxygenase